MVVEVVVVVVEAARDTLGIARIDSSTYHFFFIILHTKILYITMASSVRHILRDCLWSAQLTFTGSSRILLQHSSLCACVRVRTTCCCSLLVTVCCTDTIDKLMLLRGTVILSSIQEIYASTLFISIRRKSGSLHRFSSGVGPGARTEFGR